MTRTSSANDRGGFVWILSRPDILKVMEQPGNHKTPTTLAEERFWSRVDKTGTCWIWIGSVTGSGYGICRIDGGRDVSTHRYSYFLANGVWPNPLCRHTCDNKLCVNPVHLLAGTHRDNTQDAIDRKRWKFPPAESKLTESQVKDIRTNINNLRQAELARIYRCSPSLINQILHNKKRRRVISD